MIAALAGPDQAATLAHYRRLQVDRAIGAALTGTMVDLPGLVYPVDPDDALTAGSRPSIRQRIVDGWSRSTELAAGKVSDILRLSVDDEVIRDMQTRLMASAVPDDVYDSAMKVLDASVENRWSANRTLAEIRKAMSLTTASVVSVSEDGTEFYGYTWGTKLAQLSQVEATTTYNVAQLREMARAGATYKAWRSADRQPNRREEHLAVNDSPPIKLSAPFIVAGHPMMMPGDRSAPVDQTINCQCVVVPAG